MASRNLLAARARFGFEPIFFDVAIPKRPEPGSAATDASFPLARRPSAKIASNRRLSGPFRRTACSAPSGGVALERSARQSCASGRGTRASCFGGGYSVDRCVSWLVRLCGIAEYTLPLRTVHQRLRRAAPRGSVSRIVHDRDLVRSRLTTRCSPRWRCSKVKPSSHAV